MNNLDPRNDPVIVAAARTAVGKAKRGSLATYRPDEMAVMVVQDLLRRVEGLNPEMIDDLILGCAFPEGPQGMNVARMVGLRAGLFKFAPDPHLAENYPEAFTNMGLTAENVAEKYGISREEQDVFSLQSHQKAITAIETGAFEEQIVPLKVNLIEPGSNGHPENRTYTFKIDDGPRRDTSLEALTRLRPAFKQNGTVTAGNSSQMSDGAAGVIIMSRAKADTLGLKPLVRFIAYAVGGVPPEIMGMGPTAAVPKALELAGLSLDEIELIELNEAFAAQGLAVIRELDFNLEITNVNGGAIALGHPLGCTGAKLTVQLINEMKRRDIQFGMVTMCIGGGMGAAGIFENL
jgi:acetyl-CoA acyltransferase